MPKLEERIERLRQLRTAAPNDAAVSLARKSLRDRASLVVAEAAKLAAEHRVSDLIPDLLAAFERLLENPVKTDPKCWGKLAIVQALTRLDYGESAPFLRGARHVQMEPVWGGPQGAASQLRAPSVLARLQCTGLSRPAVLREPVDAM